MAVDSEDRILSFLEGPARLKPDKALASMGIYVFATRFLFDQLRRDAADPNSSRDRQGPDPGPGEARHGAGAPIYRILCALRLRGRRLLARCRHARRLLAGEHRSDRVQSPNSIFTTRSGRSGPTARSRRRRSSCTTWTGGAGRRSARWSLAAASFGGLAQALAAVHPLPRAFLRQYREQRGDARRRHRPLRAPAQRHHRPRRAYPGRTGGRRRSAGRRGALPAHRAGRLPDHPADARSIEVTAPAQRPRGRLGDLPAGQDRRSRRCCRRAARRTPSRGRRRAFAGAGYPAVLDALNGG